MVRRIGLFLILLSLPCITSAQDVESVKEVHLFYSRTCPICRDLKPVMEYINDHNPNLNVVFHEVEKEPDVFDEFKREYYISSDAVPRLFIGDKSFYSYSDRSGPLEYDMIYRGYIGYQNQIILAIEELAGDIRIPGEKKQIPVFNIIAAAVLLYLVTYPVLRSILSTVQWKGLWYAGLAAIIIICICAIIIIIPETDIKNAAQRMPFPLFVVTIAMADGFNPCSFSVLIIMLSLLTYARKRRDMVIMGSTFIITTALMYFIFIMLMILIGRIFIEKYSLYFAMILGVLLTVIGAVNIKDFFFLKKGLSFSLSNRQRYRINQRTRSIISDLKNSRSYVGAVTGIFFLAVMVNLIELGCTAIFPSVYMTALVTNYNHAGIYVFWTVIYSIVYVIPLTAILLYFLFTFRSVHMKEIQGRVLKLFGGVIMLIFGFFMVFFPEILTIAG